MSRHAASITAVIGASGSGKSLYVKQRLAKEKPGRLMIWDPLDEYRGHGEKIATLVEVVQASRGRSFRVRYQPRGEVKQWRDQFSMFCRIARAAGRVCLVVEELAFVTTPSWAPEGWRMATLTGRHEGMTVIGCSQRPASIDKDFFSNCTTIRCGRLNDANDVRTMARVLAVAQYDVLQLKPLEFIQRDMQTGRTATGILKLGP